MFDHVKRPGIIGDPPFSDENGVRSTVSSISFGNVWRGDEMIGALIDGAIKRRKVVLGVTLLALALGAATLRRRTD